MSVHVLRTAQNPFEIEGRGSGGGVLGKRELDNLLIYSS